MTVMCFIADCPFQAVLNSPSSMVLEVSVCERLYRLSQHYSIHTSQVCERTRGTELSKEEPEMTEYSVNHDIGALTKCLKLSMHSLIGVSHRTNKLLASNREYACLLLLFCGTAQWL